MYMLKTIEKYLIAGAQRMLGTSVILHDNGAFEAATFALHHT